MTSPTFAASKPTVLVPVSVSHQGQCVDLAVPGGVPLAELLPGMVNALGRLNAPAATQGFRVILANGTELNQSVGLIDQHVHPGSVLTLEPAGMGTADLRYDDLVEAIGVTVKSGRNGWAPENSVQLSAYSAAGMFAVAAILLMLRNDQPWVNAVLAGVGAGLVTLATLVLVRIPAIGGAVALALTVPILTSAVGVGLGGAGDGRIVGAGLGALLGSMAALLLPSRQRAVIVGPLAFGGALLLHGSLTAFVGLAPQRSASVVIALATILVFSAPWIGLARMPARIEALRLSSTNRVDPSEVARQLGNADISVLTIRIATGLLTIAFAPVVAIDPTGALLMACVGLAGMLGTRSLYSRSEVLVSMISGLLTILVAGATVGLRQPELMWWLAITVSVVGSFVLAWNVVSQKWRPWLNRVANGTQVVSLMAVLPLTMWIFGVV